MREAKTLRVLPNPWLHIHIYADGVPRAAGALHVDMVEHIPQPNRYVGATAKAEEISKEQGYRVKSSFVRTQEAKHELYWSYADAPITLPNTAYYRGNIRDGSLFAADAATASASGIPFVDPAQALANARAAKVAEFDSFHGVGSFDEAQPTPEPQTASAEPQPPELKPERKRAKD